MAPEINPVPRPEWTSLSAPGTSNVEGKALLVLNNLTVAILRFAPEGQIPEVSAPYPTDVICLEGGGFTSVAGEEGELREDIQCGGLRTRRDVSGPRQRR